MRIEDADDEVTGEDIRDLLRDFLSNEVDEYVDGFYADDIAEAVYDGDKGQLEEPNRLRELFIEYLEMKRKETPDAEN
jgi:hypothetical protein